MIRNHEITGLFLSFDDTEIEYIRRNLEAIGYAPDGVGLKQFVIDNLMDRENEPVLDRTGSLIGDISHFIEQNPEHIIKGIKMAGNIAGLFKKKK